MLRGRIDDDAVDDDEVGEEEYEREVVDAPVDLEELVLAERGVENAAERPVEFALPIPPAHSERAGEEQREHAGDSGRSSRGTAID